MHWLTAGLMLLVFALAFSIDLATSRASHTAFLQLHRSVGLSVWVLAMVRLVWVTLQNILIGPATSPRQCELLRWPANTPTRWVSPKAVAEVIVFLVSDLARAISGATLPVAGRA
jgi:NAD(P)-dependent dehydrogenase (short-subunit alcohol dehydrogenase family)